MRDFAVVASVISGLAAVLLFAFVAYESIEQPKTRWTFIWLVISLAVLVPSVLGASGAFS